MVLPAPEGPIRHRVSPPGPDDEVAHRLDRLGTGRAVDLAADRQGEERVGGGHPIASAGMLSPAAGMGVQGLEQQGVDRQHHGAEHEAVADQRRDVEELEIVRDGVADAVRPPSSSTTSTIFQGGTRRSGPPPPRRARAGAEARGGSRCGGRTGRPAPSPSRPGSSPRAPSRRITATFGILFSATARIAAVSVRPSRYRPAP